MIFLPVYLCFFEPSARRATAKVENNTAGGKDTTLIVHKY